MKAMAMMMVLGALACGGASAQQYGQDRNGRWGTLQQPPATGWYSPSTPSGIGEPRTPGQETLGGAPLRNPQGGQYLGPSQQPLGGAGGPIGRQW